MNRASTAKTGTAAAFVTTKEAPDINQQTIDYVEKFVPNETGKKFNPHVTIGVASQEFLKKLNNNHAKEGFRYRLPTEQEWEFAGAASRAALGGPPGPFPMAFSSR